MKNYNTPKAQILTFNVLEDVLNGDLDNVITPLIEADIAAKLEAATAES